MVAIKTAFKKKTNEIMGTNREVLGRWENIENGISQAAYEVFDKKNFDLNMNEV